MSLIWSRRAANNLKTIAAFIAQDNPGAAQAHIQAIIDSAETTLGTSPRAGRPGRVEGTREWVAHKRYIVVYRIRDEAVQVITVRHTAPNWPTRF